MSLLVCLFAAGCSDAPSRIHPPSIDAGSAGAGAIEKYDKNNDGRVAGEELQAAPTLRAAIDQIDANKDGAVTADEVADRIREWQESLVGKMAAMCQVKYNGQPLPGAKVVFDPEPWLGDEIKAASGTTDEYGMAMVSVPKDPDDPDDAPGVAPGFYLVRITSDQFNIPAKYNTETTLGCEMAQDAQAMQTGIEFNLVP